MVELFRRPALPLFHPAALLATWFGAGLLPLSPGTWGSLVAAALAWPLHVWAGPWALAGAAAAALGLGWWATARYIAGGDAKDPSEIVIDEVAGQWLVLAVATPAAPWTFAAGFVLFRVFDIAKPWPVSWADRRLAGAAGVMLDDILAAVYAGAVLIAMRWGADHAALS